MKFSLSFLLCFLSITFAQAGDWTGDWNSNFGPLRLVQNGERLYGDYQERGVIEGKISSDGTLARAVFVYNDGRWGTVEWVKSGNAFKGSWSWSKDQLPDARRGKSWTAERARSKTSALKYARNSVILYPMGDPNFTEKNVQNWIDAVAHRGDEGRGKSLAIRSDLSILYGGYSLTNLDNAYNIEIDVIHFEGANTAAVDISIFRGSDHHCPETLHFEFCHDLNASVDDRGFINVLTTGVSIINRGSVGEVIEASFRLKEDRNDRILRIYREATYFGASIHHKDRGFDYDGYAQQRGHLCESSQCQNAVFADIREHPNRYRGNVDRSYITRVINLPNNIDASHSKQPKICCARPPILPPNPSALFDSFVILEETGENLGQITLSPDGNRIAASGYLKGFFETYERHDTVFTLVDQTSETLTFDLVAYAGQSGESKTGRIIFDQLSHVGAGNPTGTLTIGDDILSIELVKAIEGLNPDEVGDTPAIGIYATSYSLRDVPANRTIKLRQEASRGSNVVGEIPTSSSGLQVQRCLPEIDSLVFQDADNNKRLRLLSSSWCQVTNFNIAGWLPGRYLQPE